MRPAVSDDKDKKRSVVLKKGGGNRPPVMSARDDERPFFYPENPKPKTPHDLYLTYDAKGKLRTHTVYRAPKNEPIPPKRQGKLEPKAASPVVVENKNKPPTN